MNKVSFTLILLVFLHFFILSNLRFTAWPEIFSFPYLKNNGFLLYKDMVHAYPPVLTVILSIIYKVFGYNLEILKLTTWLLILCNDLLIYKITSKLTKNKAFSLVAVAAYVLIQPFLDGNQLWFDFALTTPLLFGLLFYLNKNLLLSGIFFAVAALTKQTGAFFYLITLFWLIYTKESKRGVKRYIYGSLSLGLIFIYILFLENQFREFVTWVVYYPSVFWSKFPGYVQLSLTTRELAILALIISPSLFLISKNFKKMKNHILVLLFFGAGLASIYPRFSFFHFQTALPFLVIIYGLAGKAKYIVAFGVIFFLFVIKPLVIQDWKQPTRFLMPSDLALAKFAQDHIRPTEKVYLLGLPSQLYVFSNRLPPKPWIDNYGWVFEIPGVQEELINGWEESPPKYIYWQLPNKGNWYEIGAYQPKLVVEWVHNNYTRQANLSENIEIWQKN